MLAEGQQEPNVFLQVLYDLLGFVKRRPAVQRPGRLSSSSRLISTRSRRSFRALLRLAVCSGESVCWASARILPTSSSMPPTVAHPPLRSAS